MFTLRLSLSFCALLATFLPVNSQATVRINALGDSITGSPGCWRAILWQKLQAANVKNTDFVGTLNPDGCGFTYDGQHDGHGGFLATGIVRDNQLPGWLAVSQPDIVMMELGTNDVWSAIPPATIITALDTLVNQMRAKKPTMRILVAKITPMSPSGCTDCPTRVVAYNSAIAAWAPGKSTDASPITVVDCWTGFTSSDFGDGVHPNESGNQKLANCWYEPLKAAIILAGGGTTTTLSTSVTSRTTTPVVISTTSRTTTARITTIATTAVVTTSSSSGTGAPLWGQCGGQGFTGPTTCAVGTCKFSNQWYSQCLM